MKYDAAKNSRDSYDEAIDELRKRKELEKFRCERIGDAVLYCGDCLEILPLLGKVDAVVTDPPYGIKRFERGSLRFDRANKYPNGLTWDKKPENGTLQKILALSKTSIIWGANNFALPESESFLVWDKQQTVDNFASAELAFSNIPNLPAKVFRYSIHQFNCDEPNRPHKTQKPVALMRWCIEHLPDKTNTILDCFMGVGTTGVACAKLGRKFIGIEIDETYFEIACKRIRDAYAQPDLFIEPPKEPQQSKLFGEES